VCVIYMLSSICSSNIMLVIIFSRFQQILMDYGPPPVKSLVPCGPQTQCHMVVL